ncbi:MAG: glycosyltransferase, partial [Myxococcota bacterium]
MRVYLAAFGTYGDVRPILSIAESLKRRGVDQVLVLANPFFKERITRAGVEFRPVGERIDPEAMVQNPRLRHPYLGPLRIWSEVFEPQVALFYEALMAEGVAPDIVVNHPWCFGGMLAAEKLQRPWAVVSLAPLTWFSCEDPPMASAFEPPAWLHKWSVAGPLRWMMNSTFGPDLARFARAHGLPKRKSRYFYAMRGASLNVGLWSKHVRGVAANDAVGWVVCG